MKYYNIKKIILVFFLLLGLTVILATIGCVKKSDLFHDENVVAQFANGVITTDQLTTYIRKIGPKCHTPVMGCHASAGSGCGSGQSCAMGDSQMAHGPNVSSAQTGQTMSGCCGGQHGGEHAGCCGGSETAFENQACEEHENCCMQHYDLKAGDYRNLVKAMVLEQMLLEYIRENKIGQEKDTQDLIKYVAENVYITDTHLEMEVNMRPAESEIRKFYEENKKLFGLKTLNEVRDDITEILKKKMHYEYMPKYLAELQRNAFIRKNLELLVPREPSEYELQTFYREHRSKFEEPEEIYIRQILTHSRQKAEQAQSKLRSGADFTTVAETYSEGPFADSGGEVPYFIKRGDRSKTFEENIFKLREGETGFIFEDDGSFYIVQVTEKQERRTKSFEEIADSVRESLLIEKEEKLFADNAQRTLFTVNNRSYTIGEFKRQYDMLPLSARAQFRTISGKEKMIDLMIEYELLVDDARHKMFDLKNKETIQDITNAILQGTLYETEVVGKIKSQDISTEEAMEYYKENKERFIMPPRAIVSYIRIPISTEQQQDTKPSESEVKAAKLKAEEAYKMINGGTEFEEVARMYSVDDWSSQKIEMVEEKDMPLVSSAETQVHPLHKVVFTLNEGEISKPFEFENNYFIFKLWEKNEEEYVAFEKVEPTIKQVLVIQKRKELEETLKNELMEKSQLVVNKRAIKVLAKKQAKKKPQTEEAHEGHSG